MPKYQAEPSALPQKKSTGSKTLLYLEEYTNQTYCIYTTISLITNTMAFLQWPGLPLIVSTCLLTLGDH